jgi:hypothetical protein
MKGDASVPGAKICSYCGARPATDKEHVFPRNLYPDSKATSRVQRLTIPACSECNGSWSDDEVHFRNTLALPGDPNASRKELLDGPIRRSLFGQPDGVRRIRDLGERLRAVEVDGKQGYKIYPGEDARVVRVMKKIVRGLSHHHQIESAVPESRVWADVQRYPIQEDFLSEMIYRQREADIAQYRYAVVGEYDIQSAWLVTFFEKLTFLGIVFVTADALDATFPPV